MVRIGYRVLTLLAVSFFSLAVVLHSASLAQERTTPRGTLKVVDLWNVQSSVVRNYAEGLVMLDKDNTFVPCLAESWKWINERTIEFRLRRGVFFHNGEKFNAEAVRINWEAYKALKSPSAPFLVIPDETVFEILDEYTVRFAFSEPDGLALAKFGIFFQAAPGFIDKHKFPERNWGLLSEPGPWGTGPFKWVEGSAGAGKVSERVVLEAYENYWDPRYPLVKTVIFENALLKDVEEAARICRETEGSVDIVSFIRPLHTLKVATSPFAKVVKS
jgi:peptide/nickel transport system substrate-binding protein